MPIGAILLYKTGDNNGITEYQLIDGLQRVTTLKKYYEKPTDFYDEENLNEEFVKDVTKFLKNIVSEVDEEKIKRIIIDWIKSIRGFKEHQGFSSFDLAEFIDNKISELYGKEIGKKELSDLTNLLKPYLQMIKEDSDISNFKVPVIIYTGEQSELPIIFERINSKGTQLTNIKYLQQHGQLIHQLKLVIPRL